MEKLTDPLWITVFVLQSVAAVCATIHIVMNKRDSRAAIGWVGLVLLAPVVGSLTYFAFGVNRIRRRAQRLRQDWSPRPPTLTARDQERAARFAEAYPSLAGLAQLGRQLTGRSLLPGNAISPLQNGDEAYPEMIAAIQAARHSVSLVSYIFDHDRAGQAFLDALRSAHERGVAVRVLIDDVGARYSRPSMVTRLRAAGVPVAAFLPTLIPRLFKYANLRNHRKILVVDGQVGFTGGTNIREGHWFSLTPAHPVRCVHFRVEGPVVAQMQEAFSVDWTFATGEPLTGEAWFPETPRCGEVWARGIPDGPDEDFEKLADTIQGALATATRSVTVVTPYFLPDQTLIRALCVTALRGVKVHILVPERNNIRIVDWATAASFGQLLQKGCRIFLTPKPFDHTKLMVVDQIWSLIGSTNWDARSLRLNFEFNVECYDETLAAQLMSLARDRQSAAREVTLEQLDGSSWSSRLRTGIARLATPYL